MFIGSILFEFMGVLVRWALQFPLFLFSRTRIKSFKEVWDGPGDSKPSETLLYGFSNIMLGVLVWMLIIYFMLWVE